MGVNRKSHAVVLQKKSPFPDCDRECLQFALWSAGEEDGKESITYGVGVQVSCCVGVKNRRKIMHNKLGIILNSVSAVVKYR